MASELVDFTINVPKLLVFELDGNLERNNQVINAHFAIEGYITKNTDNFKNFQYRCVARTHTSPLKHLRLRALQQ